MTFPNAHSRIDYNEEGEVLGWDNPNYDEPEICDQCGYSHAGECYDPDEDEDETRPCYECRSFDGVTAPERKVISTFTTEAHRDPTLAYRLECGHATIDC